MTRYSIPGQISSERGVCYLETVLVLPLLLLLLFGTALFGSAMRAKQTQLHLSREIANTVQRNCITLIRNIDPSKPISSDQQLALENCLSASVGGFAPVIEASGLRSKVLLSVYQDVPGGVRSLAHFTAHCNLQPDCPQYQSRLSTDSVEYSFTVELERLGWIVLVEVYADAYSTVSSNLPFLPFEVKPLYVGSIS